jgi:hypothetical protein
MQLRRQDADSHGRAIAFGHSDGDCDGHSHTNPSPAHRDALALTHISADLYAHADRYPVSGGDCHCVSNRDSDVDVHSRADG